MPTATGESENFYPVLIGINRRAFARAEYEVAYHALAAALHVACDDADLERISDVRRIALRQSTWIDTHRPEHRLSSSSASARGRKSMFSMLERQAEAAAHIDLITRPRWKRP